MLLVNLLVTILNRNVATIPEKKPWEKGNSEVIKTSISDITFFSTRVYYNDAFNGNEYIRTGISDITIAVTKI